MNSPAPSSARISIIGAGPGGLTCARILQRHGLQVTVYDAESGPHARNQGGTLDLHADNGQIALREAGLLDEFFRLSRPEGQEMRQLDIAGNLLARDVPAVDDRFKPEIDRGQLRDLLLGSVWPETVEWNRALESVGGPEEGPRQLRFADGTVVETDLVIGADGAFSRVRPAVSAAVPQYAGATFLEAWFDEVETRHADLSDLVGQGSATATDGDRAVFAQRNSGGHIRAYIIQRVPIDWMRAASLSPGDTAGIRAYLLDRFAAWSPRMLQMITENDGPYVDRPLFVLPVPHTWAPVPTLTLLGDAAHLMPPLGVGVNLAMLDASDLALALAGSETVDTALRAYEHIMLPRSAELARALEGGAEMLLAVDDPAGEDRFHAFTERGDAR